MDPLLRHASQSPLYPEDTQAIANLIHKVVGDGLAIESMQASRNPVREPWVVRGTLLQPSHSLFPQWLAEFNRHGFTPFLRPDGQVTGAVGDSVLLEVASGTVRATPSNPWINLILFVVTLISTLWVGALYGDLPADVGNDLGEVALRVLTTPALLWSGWPFAVALLGILTAHEFGHYFAARYHKVAVTLPYFLPMPLGFGTLGAFIRLKEPVPDRRKLFDIGVAGPLAGLIIALPLLYIGLSTSVVEVPPPMPGAVLEGNSLLYYAAKYWIHGQTLPNPITGQDVMMNRVAFAAWIGLLVTALNLLPLGQLDGGHTVFALFGRRARPINLITLAGMAALGVAGLQAVQQWFPMLYSVGWAGWFVWLILITLMGGPFHPPALDDVTTLNRPRRWLGYLVVVIFLVTFVPVPLRPL